MCVCVCVCVCVISKKQSFRLLETMLFSHHFSSINNFNSLLTKLSASVPASLFQSIFHIPIRMIFLKYRSDHDIALFKIFLMVVSCFQKRKLYFRIISTLPTSLGTPLPFSSLYCTLQPYRTTCNAMYRPAL